MVSHVPFLDLSRRTVAYEEAFVAATRRVLHSGSVLLGTETATFEASFAAWAGMPHAVTVSSGATALQLVLSALGVGPGHEVIVPALTAVPTASAVCATGAVPVIVDVDDATACMSAEAAADAVTPRTRAVVPVHLYGFGTHLPDLGVPVLDDAAQAHGAVPPGGSSPRSVAVAYSFYPTKNLGGIGDGGAVVTAHDDLAATVRRLRVHGMTEQYVHTEVSQNFRMSELEAAWLALTLPGLAAGNERRRTIARRYREAAPHLTWQQWQDTHAMHLCVVRVPDRPAFRAALAGQGVATGVHYPLALTQQPAYRALARHACPHAEAWAAACVSLPCNPELTDAEVDRVAEVLASVRA